MLSIYLLFVFAAASISFAAIQTPHLTVRHDGVHERYARLVAETAEQSLLRITDALAQTPPDSITVIVADTEERFRELTRGTLPDWSVAAALPDGKIILSPLSGQKIEAEKILAHEIVHVIINDAAEEEPVPRWFHEGCAELFSGGWGFRNELYMVWKVNRNDLMTFDDIQDVFSTGPLDAGLAYDQSLAAVRYMVKRYHRAVLTRILNDMRSGEIFPQAFLNATGLLPTQFEDEYHQFLRERYGPGSLIILAPTTWTFMMMLFLAVYFIKRSRSRRKLQEWEREEALHPEPSPSFDEGEDDEPYDEFEEYPDDEPEDESGRTLPGNRPTILPFKSRPRRYGGWSDDSMDQ